jgi:hypothetical protein
MTRIAVQYKQALLHCDALHAEAAGTWKVRLEAEYAKLSATLNEWADARHAWVEAKSAALSHELQHDLDLLKERYQQLKAQVQLHRNDWQLLLARLGGLRLARA